MEAEKIAWLMAPEEYTDEQVRALEASLNRLWTLPDGYVFGLARPGATVATPAGPMSVEDARVMMGEPDFSRAFVTTDNGTYPFSWFLETPGAEAKGSARATDDELLASHP